MLGGVGLAAGTCWMHVRLTERLTAVTDDETHRVARRARMLLMVHFALRGFGDNGRTNTSSPGALHRSVELESPSGKHELDGAGTHLLRQVHPAGPRRAGFGCPAGERRIADAQDRRSTTRSSARAHARRLWRRRGGARRRKTPPTPTRQRPQRRPNPTSHRRSLGERLGHPPEPFPSFTTTDTPAVFADKLAAGRPMLIFFYDTASRSQRRCAPRSMRSSTEYRGLIDLVTFSVGADERRARQRRGQCGDATPANSA